MTLGDVKNLFTSASYELTKLIRNYAFAGIGFVWLFRISPQAKNAQSIDFPDYLLWALLFFVVTLLFDLIFYIYATIMPWAYLRHFEKKNKKTKEKTKIGKNKDGSWSPLLPLPKHILRWLKVLCCLVGYMLIFLFILVDLGLKNRLLNFF